MKSDLRASALTRIMAVLAVALFAAACGDESVEASAASPAATVQIAPEDITVVAFGELRTGPSLSGSLAAREQAVVRAEVGGPVMHTYVEAGEAVRRGTLIARIDDAAIRESHVSARSALRSAQLSAENAERDLERSTRLAEAGAIAERDLEAARRGQLAAAAAVADAQARLANVSQQLDRTRLRAPFAGVVSERPVSAGDVVAPGTAVATVIDPSSMRLEATVPTEQLAALRVGQPVSFTVSGYPDRAFTGRVERINPAADPATRQVRIYVAIPNQSGRLVSGLFAEGRVASESRQALRVPSAAVDVRGLTPTVMRLRGGTVAKVPVQLGIRDEADELVEIRSGVSAGDSLLLGAAQSMTPGTTVRVMTTSDRPSR